ncbi:MAG: hypothetical protein ACFE9R_15050 [Candidatus Hermodarchaeota archaeon]
MSLDKGKDISWAFKIILIAILLGAVYIVGLILNFTLTFFIGLLIGIVIAFLIFLIIFKMPKIYVKVSKY